MSAVPECKKCFWYHYPDEPHGKPKEGSPMFVAEASEAAKAPDRLREMTQRYTAGPYRAKFDGTGYYAAIEGPGISGDFAVYSWPKDQLWLIIKALNGAYHAGFSGREK